ncbi:hypothetical protein [Methylocystis sp. SC2]|uniref:hypothetical protein n=1 Tax=Methylocystis sp. (strain SC2) TaxID=187303 RepID=UPI00027AF51E|nr:hypothetical protein [Methylocystis sp. SC2]CCJ09042.1 Hypothetical protein BN69_3591 [Methylocystis sp. SC2]
MERRTLITALLAGFGATVVVSQAQALSGLAPLQDGMAPARPELGVATSEDMQNAKIEKSWWRRRRYWRRTWRRRRWRRRW